MLGFQVLTGLAPTPLVPPPTRRRVSEDRTSWSAIDHRQPQSRRRLCRPILGWTTLLVPLEQDLRYDQGGLAGCERASDGSATKPPAAIAPGTKALTRIPKRPKVL